MRKSILFVLVLIRITHCLASHKDSASNNEKFRLRAVPVVSFAPETRLLFGLGGLATFQLNNDTSTHYSLIAAFIAYTENNQDYIYVPYYLYTKDNNYYFEGEADYYNFSYYYWGIGTDRTPQELYNVQFPRLQLNAFRKIIPHFYAGIDYYFEKDKIVGTLAGGELSEGDVPGCFGSTSSGIGADLLFDTRDSVYYPSKGWYIKALSYFNSPSIGASSTYGKIMTDISWYHKLSEPVILAVNEHTQLTWGDVPFNQLALVGGSKQMRGYYTGYYRDDVLTYLQAEARIHLVGRFGLAAFASAGLLGNYTVFPETPSPILAEGVGLRYNYATKRHVNLRLDVGYGYTVEFYLTIQEAF